ncbi:MAG TPA: sulfotransferase domain-containing protein, partial [Reyranella sp.]|nr:sulfotransferase domain-containing protein [Reyranella sp.]
MRLFGWRRSRPLPVLATIPRSGTFFIRYAVSFYCHLKRGGRVTDRLTGQSFGDPAGPPFDFERFRGGPLFQTRPALAVERMLIGHAVCPGFSRIAGDIPWWSGTPFHAAGYDYLNEGLNYRYTPVEFARGPFAVLDPDALEALPWTDERQRMVLVYREPVAQAQSYFQFCKNHVDPERRKLGGRWLEDIGFGEYLFEAALPSYAKLFVTYQQMAVCLPDQVRLVAYERLMQQPEPILAEILGFLDADVALDGTVLHAATELARAEHLQAIERELNRSLDGTRSSGSHIQRPRSAGSGTTDAALYARAADWLAEKGIDPDRFVWP